VNLELQHTGDPFWKDRVSIAEPLVAVNNANEETNARLRGIAIHDALSKIQTPNDINAAVHSLVEQGRISDADVGLIITHITNLLERSELKPLFAKGMRIRNEADIQLENGHWLRPDRVVSQGQKSWVIDYKTGAERPEHKRQIEEYRSAMNELGFEEVKGLLVYLDSEKVVHV
jgi:CRISPR/Cas system-associated exonuclease Cas4 (RecB family)